MAKQNRYQKLIEKIFFDGFEENISVIPFERAQLESSADELKNTLPKNLGNVIYQGKQARDIWALTEGMGDCLCEWRKRYVSGRFVFNHIFPFCILLSSPL